MIQPANTVQHIPGSAVPVLFGRGVVQLVCEHVRALGQRVILVTDPGVERAGHAQQLAASLRAIGIELAVFSNVEPNPTTACVDAGVAQARQFSPDVLVAIGGGSAMDVAKGINFILTNGGTMRDYWGVGKATKPMLPTVLIPTTAGTGSEAQSAALISDADTHTKMACLDKKALARLAVLDPDLAVTAPRQVIAAVGIDAVAHAIESGVANNRTPVSQQLSAEARILCEAAFARLMAGDLDAMSDMLLGAHLAGAAIENSMLGAAHACANPLTATFGITHGVAVGVMLPHVMRFNQIAGADAIDQLLQAASLPRHLAPLGVTHDHIPALVAAAATQWTLRFNPRPATRDEIARLYTAAL